MDIAVLFSLPDKAGTLGRNGKPIRHCYQLSALDALEAYRAVKAANGNRGALAFLGGGVPSGVLEGLTDAQANDLLNAWEAWAGVAAENAVVNQKPA